MSEFDSSEGLELLLDANGGRGFRNSPCRARRIASFLMLSTDAPSSSEALDQYLSRGLAGFSQGGMIGVSHC
jgi:hypothetical protein